METKEPGIFCTPEEIDAIIKQRINCGNKKGGKSSKKWSDREKLLRRKVVLEYICEQGLSRRATALQIMDRWGVVERQAYRYIEDAIASIAESYGKAKIEDYRQTHMERLEAILQILLDTHNYQEAVKITDQIAKINSLYTEKKEIKVDNDVIQFKFGDEQ